MKPEPMNTELATTIRYVIQRSPGVEARGALERAGLAKYAGRGMKWTSWLTAATLAAIIGFVVWSSLHVGRVRCEVCIDFGGRQACRSVDGPTRVEARASAINNACAFLASGVTQVMACERSPPTRERCDG